MVGDDWTKPEASLRKSTLRNRTCKMQQQAVRQPHPIRTPPPTLVSIWKRNTEGAMALGVDQIYNVVVDQKKENGATVLEKQK